MTSLDDAATPAARYARILPADQLRDGDLLPLEVDGTPVVLVRHRGEFFATANNCTHQDFPLSEAGFDQRDGYLICAWHQACFDVRTGAAVITPRSRPFRCGSAVTVGWSSE
jgi:3-phenylpropionate/trans-cinnamate dioxygenase ferredoxin subunit